MLSRLYYLTCDRCGALSSEGEWSASVARRAAHRAGWKRIRGERYRGHVAGRDLCPKCNRDRDGEQTTDPEEG